MKQNVAPLSRVGGSGTSPQQCWLVVVFVTFAMVLGPSALHAEDSSDSSSTESSNRRVSSVPTGGLFCHSSACASAFYDYDARRFSTAASAFESAIPSEIHAGGSWSDAVLLLIGSARASYREGLFIEAGHRWQRVDASSSQFDELAQYRALHAYARAESPPHSLINSLLRQGALETPFPGRGYTRLLVKAHLEDDIRPVHIDEAIAANRPSTCAWLRQQRDTNELQIAESGSRDGADGLATPETVGEYLWSECPGTETTSNIQPPTSPSVAAKLRRANRLFDLVRYDAAYEAIETVPLSQVDDLPTRCGLRFRLARIHERRDDHNRAARSYEQVLSQCSKKVAPDPHIRSYYALGDHHFDRRNFEASRKAFEALLDTYPERSHADDALLFLGRIARERGNRKRESELLSRALKSYPTGDMVHEFVWEYLEGLVRDEEWQSYLDELAALELPEYDEQPYSQGRLAYYRGRAHRQLGDPDRAAQIWASTWRRYPFSFYGYLSRLHVAPDESVKTELMPEQPSPPGWFVSTDDSEHDVVAGTRRLLSAGFSRLALKRERGFEGSASSTGSRTKQLWRMAALWDRLGAHHHSHNVARIRIDKRPWVDPSRGRLARWTVAYPDAHRDMISRAIFAELQSHRDATLRPSLASALMREESAFLVDVESWAGALGLMQLMPATARGHASVIPGEATRQKLLEAWPNIRIGISHLFMLADDFSNHPIKMIAAYNAGGGAVRSWPSDHVDIALWVEDIPYRQTRHYVKRVMGSYAAYQWLAGRRLDPRVARRP